VNIAVLKWALWDCVIVDGSCSFESTGESMQDRSWQRLVEVRIFPFDFFPNLQFECTLIRGTAEYLNGMSAPRGMEDDVDEARLQLRQALAHCAQDRVL